MPLILTATPWSQHSEETESQRRSVTYRYPTRPPAGEHRIIGMPNQCLPDCSLSFRSWEDVGWGSWNCATGWMSRALPATALSSPTLTPSAVSRVKWCYEDGNEKCLSLEKEFTRASWAEVLLWGGGHQGQREKQGCQVQRTTPRVSVSCARRRILRSSIELVEIIHLWALPQDTWFETESENLKFRTVGLSPTFTDISDTEALFKSLAEHLTAFCWGTGSHAEPQVPKGSGATKANDTDCELWTHQNKTHSWHKGLCLDIVFYLTSYIQISLLHLSVFVEKTKPQTLKSCPICMAHLTSVREPSEGSLINYNRTIILNSLPPSATTAWGFRKLLSG